MTTQIIWCKKTAKRLPTAADRVEPTPDTQHWAALRPGTPLYICWRDHAVHCDFSPAPNRARLWDEEDPLD